MQRTAPCTIPGPKTRRAGVTRATAITLSACAAIALAGCYKDRPHQDTYVLGWTMPDPSMRHPIIVTDAPVVMEVDAPRGTTGLNYTQQAQVGSFLGEYREGANGLLTVAAPSGSRNAHAASRAAHSIRHLANKMGISNADIAMTPYAARGHHAAPVRISFSKAVANAPKCGEWPENLANSDRNANYHNFGCAQQQNLAAMIANPRDLLEPSQLDPTPSERRDVRWPKYIAGETTGAERSGEEQAGVEE